MFESRLRTLVASVALAEGAAVINLSGVVVQAVDATGIDPEPGHAFPELGRVIKQLEALDEFIPLGARRVVEVRGLSRNIIAYPLSQKYLLVLWMSPDAATMKARFKLRVAAPEFAMEL